MAGFRDTYQDALLEKAPYSRSDQANYRPWTRRFAQWLYSTSHISIEYGISYDGTDIRKLSPARAESFLSSYTLRSTMTTTGL